MEKNKSILPKLSPKLKRQNAKYKELPKINRVIKTLESKSNKKGLHYFGLPLKENGQYKLDSIDFKISGIDDIVGYKHKKNEKIYKVKNKREIKMKVNYKKPITKENAREFYAIYVNRGEKLNIKCNFNLSKL